MRGTIKPHPYQRGAIRPAASNLPFTSHVLNILGRSDIPRRLNDPQDANHWPDVPKAPMGRPLLVALLLRRHH